MAQSPQPENNPIPRPAPIPSIAPRHQRCRIPPSEVGGFATVFGHPAGLFTLFFAEMWERFSYYGMRALLVFYMIKGFLGYGDKDAYAVYGAYTALVYMTPFFGGLLADRLLGQRRAVILGGIFMAAGHLLMGGLEFHDHDRRPRVRYGSSSGMTASSPHWPC